MSFEGQNQLLKFPEISSLLEEEITKVIDNENRKLKIKIKYELLKRISKNENLNIDYLLNKYLKGWKLNEEDNKLINEKESVSSLDESVDQLDKSNSESEHLLTEISINGKNYWKQDLTNENSFESCKIFDSNYNVVGHYKNGKPLITTK